MAATAKEQLFRFSTLLTRGDFEGLATVILEQKEVTFLSCGALMEVFAWSPAATKPLLASFGLMSVFELEKKLHSLPNPFITDYIVPLLLEHKTAFGYSLLGHIYYKGFPGAPRDLRRALKYFHTAQSKGSIYAACTLAYLYTFSEEDLVNPPKSVAMLNRALAMDSTLGIYYYAHARYNNCIKEESSCAHSMKDCFTTAANNALPSAYYYLAKIQYKQRRKKLAMQHYDEGASLGDPKSQLELGILYFKGRYVKRNKKRAIELFKSSEKQGNARASYWLGLCHLGGIGVPRNFLKAKQYFSDSSKQNDKRARFHIQYIDSLELDESYHRDELVFFGSPDANAKNYADVHTRLYSLWDHTHHEYIYSMLDNAMDFLCSEPTAAFEFYQARAIYGEEVSQYQVALCYRYGISIESNNALFLEWLQKAVDRHLNAALFLQGSLLLSKEIEPLNSYEAFELLGKASQRGHIDAKLQLVDCFITLSKNPNDISSFRNLKKGAELKIDYAEYLLAKQYPSPITDPKNSEHLFALLEDASQKGLAEAQLELGSIYLSLKDEPNYENALEKAKTLLSAAAAQFLPEAQFLMASLQVFHSEDWLSWVTIAADNHWAEAEFVLATYFESSSPSDAIYWFRRASYDGYTKAKPRYISLEFGGNGEGTLWESFKPKDRKTTLDSPVLGRHLSEISNQTPEDMLHIALSFSEQNDKVKALDWMLKAADAGNAEAQYQTAIFFQQGSGVDPNPIRAKAYFVMAKEQGHQRASKLLSSFEKATTVENLHITTLAASAEQGDAEAQYQLGLIYAEGKLISKDFMSAASYFRDAMKQDHPGAKSNFTYLYSDLTGSKIPSGKRIETIMTYAYDGFDRAQYELGMAYKKGLRKGDGPDMTQAFRWFELAAEQKLVPALFEAAICIMEGSGTDIDFKQAIKYLLQIPDHYSGSDVDYKQVSLKLDSCYAQLKENYLTIALDWFASSPFYSKIEKKHKGKGKRQKAISIPKSRRLSVRDLQEPVLRLHSAEIDSTFLEGNTHITSLYLFNPSIKCLQGFYEGIDGLPLIETLVIIDVEHVYHPSFCKSLQTFIRRHKPTLTNLVFHFCGVHTLLEWNETLPVQVFGISDPTYSISEFHIPLVVGMLARCNTPHVSIQGFQSEEICKKIIKGISTERKELQSYLYLDFLVPGVPDQKGKIHGKLRQILQSMSSSSSSSNFVRPTDYEYALIAKLAYKEDANLISKASENFFWLSVTGWKIVTFHVGSGGYRAVIVINDIKRQIVIASRGTKTNNFGALHDDVAGVYLGAKVEQHSSAVQLLVDVIDQKMIPNINIVPKCIAAGCYSNQESKASSFDYQLSFTGHSLGAWLSEILVVEACIRSVYSRAVTFDCPGSKKMLTQICSDSQCSIDIDQLDIMNYVAAPNIFNMCNEQVGRVNCILSKKINDKFHQERIQFKSRKWVSSAGALHTVNNFIAAGSEETGEIERAVVQGCWPMGSIAKAADGTRAFREYLDYTEKYFLAPLKKNATKLEVKQNFETKCGFLESVYKISSLKLVLPPQYSFLLIRLFPTAQTFLRKFNHLKSEGYEQITELAREHTFLSQFISLQFGNTKASSTQADIVQLKSGTKCLDFINHFHQFLLSTEHQTKVCEINDLFKESEISEVKKIEKKFEFFAEFLHIILLNKRFELQTLLEKHHLQKETNPTGLLLTPKTDEVSMDYILSYIRLSLTDTKCDLGAMFKEVHVLTMNLLATCIDKASQELPDCPCTFSLLGLGSIGKQTPLPYHNHRCVIITESRRKEVTDYFSLFQARLTHICATHKLPITFIYFGDCMEVFNFLIRPNPEAKISTAHLFQLCKLWDASHLCGDINLSNQVKHVVTCIFRSTDHSNNGQPRSQQFVQSFFCYLKKELSAYSKKTSADFIDIRLLVNNLSKLCNLISIYYNLNKDATIWTRMEAFLRIGCLSPSYCDQLLCIVDLVSSYWARAQLFYSNSTSCMIYPPNTPADPTKLIVNDSISFDILLYAQREFILTLGNQLFAFAHWVERCDAGMNPLLAHAPHSVQLVLYYHEQATFFSTKGERLDWHKVFSFCSRAIMHRPPSTLKHKNQLLDITISLDQLMKESEQRKENETQIGEIVHSFLTEISSLFPKSLAKKLTSPLQASMEKYENRPKRLTDHFLSQFLHLHLCSHSVASKDDNNNIQRSIIGDTTSIMEGLQSIFQEWFDSQTDSKYSTHFLSQFYDYIVLFTLWPEKKDVLGRFRDLALDILQVKFLAVLRHCLHFCGELWNSLLTTFIKPCCVIDLSQVLISIVPYDLAGTRGITEIAQREMTDLFDVITTDIPCPNRPCVFIKWASPLLYEYCDKKYNQNTIVNHKRMTEIIQEQLFTGTHNGLVLAENSTRRSMGEEIFMLPIRVNYKIVAYVRFYPHFPLLQTAVNALARRISGDAINSCAAQLELYSEGTDGDVTKVYPVLVTKEIQGSRLSVPLTNNLDQYQMIEQHLSGYHFTMKVIETLLTLPKYDGPDNLIAVPFKDPRGKSYYRLISQYCDASFVPATMESEDGQELVNVRQFLYCLPQMKQLLDHQAIKTFLSLSPYHIVREWLSSLKEIEKVMVNPQGEYGATPLFNDVSLPIENREYGKETVLRFDFSSVTISALYHRLVKLHGILQEDFQRSTPKLTHIEIVGLLEPRLALYYSESQTLFSAYEGWKSLPIAFRAVSHAEIRRSRKGKTSGTKTSNLKQVPLRKSTFPKMTSSNSVMRFSHPSARTSSTGDFPMISSSELMVPHESYSCEEGLSQIEVMKSMFSDVAKRRKQLLAGDIQEALSDICSKDTSKLSYSRQQSDKMAKGFVIQQIFDEVNWQDVRAALHRNHKTSKIPVAQFVEENIKYAMNVLLGVDNIQELYLRHLKCLDDVMIRSFVTNSCESLRVLDLSGSSNINSSTLRIIAKYSQVLDELHLNQVDLVTFDGNNFSFRFLRKLYLKECPALSRVHLKQLPKLEHVTVADCSSLKKFTVGSLSKAEHFGALNYLSFVGCDSLSYSSFSTLYTGLTNDGYRISTMWATKVQVTEEEGVKFCCIKVNNCLALFSSACKRNSPPAEFINKAIM